MKKEYVITTEELAEKGLNLHDYASDESYIPAIINVGLDIAVDRICELNDNFQYESDIETDIDKNPKKVAPFKKLQYRIIYNLIFQAETGPTDQFVDTIIAQQLRWGKINGFQKGLFYRYN